MTRSGTRVSRSIVQRAEALLRSLIGVSRAEVHVRPTGGVECVRLVADGCLSNGQMVQNVRSALLAALGVVLQPGQIEFVDATSWTPVQDSVAADQPAPVEPAAPESVSTPAASRHEPPDAPNGRGLPASGPAIRLPHGAGNGLKGGNGNGSGNGNGHGRSPAHGNGSRTSALPHYPAWPHMSHGTPGPAETVAATRTRGVRASNGTAESAGLASAAVAVGARSVHLEKIELLRQSGRLRCRIVLAAGGDRYSAVADCTDEPLAELQLAARVTCDALRAGDLTYAHFEGATVAQVAGAVHVLVALNGWNGGLPIRRSGSAVIQDSVEQAAALAVLDALANT